MVAFSVKPIETEKKFSSSNNKPRIGYDKHDFKRDREYDADRAHQTAMPRAPPTAISKYENSNVFNLGRERDMRNDPRGRDNASSVSGSRYVKLNQYIIDLNVAFAELLLYGMIFRLLMRLIRTRADSFSRLG